MTKHATTASPRRRKGMTATAKGQDRFNEPVRAMDSTVTRDPEAVRRLAALRGLASAKTAPMDNAERAEHYRRQRGGATAVAPVLTDRQRRRLRKNRRAGHTQFGVRTDAR